MATTHDEEPPPPGGAPRRRFDYWLPLTLVIGLLLGTALGYFLPHRSERPDEKSAEAGFAWDMTTHHTQAVEMGMIAYTRAQHSDTRSMARDIALTQAGQMGMFQAWLREWGLGPNNPNPPMAWMPDGAASVRDGLMPGMATMAELDQLRAATGLAEDRLFLKLMIQHHLGGIHMAQEVVKRSTDSEVVEAAQLAIDNQQRELTDMRTLQTKVGASP